MGRSGRRGRKDGKVLVQNKFGSYPLRGGNYWRIQVGEVTQSDLHFRRIPLGGGEGELGRRGEAARNPGDPRRGCGGLEQIGS